MSLEKKNHDADCLEEPLEHLRKWIRVMLIGTRIADLVRLKDCSLLEIDVELDLMPETVATEIVEEVEKVRAIDPNWNMRCV